MIRFLVIIISVLLFYMEPIFGLFSPIEINGDFFVLVPRFLIMYLIFVSIYYDRKRAMLFGLFFGLLYDVFFIDIIGLYSFIYPLMCLVASLVVKYVHQHLLVATVLTLILVAVVELLLFFFYTFIGIKSMTFVDFYKFNLLPTMIANFVFLAMFGWGFKYILLNRFNQKALLMQK
ncbi:MULTISPECIES: rod shape-determining protein MreD [Bacillaceae]|uniref:rod shape-determining protein MreD n=1 Tax=Bacillaceae TaxID=186817 RepID=UPI0006F7763C|nr:MULTISPECIES: rod shape-determining protein MreD [Bacillaceae]KQL34121.1 rod shape-determining protein MreD [Psychrobacillus sp. FJAT-21963]MDF2066204.1 rod shape-determining protein MreD [Bacillus sp. Cr_A10]